MQPIIETLVYKHPTPHPQPAVNPPPANRCIFRLARYQISMLLGRHHISTLGHQLGAIRLWSGLHDSFSSIDSPVASRGSEKGEVQSLIGKCGGIGLLAGPRSENSSGRIPTQPLEDDPPWRLRAIVQRAPPKNLIRPLPV